MNHPDVQTLYKRDDETQEQFDARLEVAWRKRWGEQGIIPMSTMKSGPAIEAEMARDGVKTTRAGQLMAEYPECVPQRSPEGAAYDRMKAAILALRATGKAHEAAGAEFRSALKAWEDEVCK